jgi:hypothetical protein
MKARRAVAGLFLVLAWSACSGAKPAASAGAAGPGPAAVKEICQHDEDCAPYLSCTSDHHCRCEVDSECAPTQVCQTGLCMPK